MVLFEFVTPKELRQLRAGAADGSAAARSELEASQATTNRSIRDTTYVLIGSDACGRPASDDHEVLGGPFGSRAALRPIGPWERGERRRKPHSSPVC